MTAQIIAKELGKKYKRFPNHWARLAEYFTGGRFCGHQSQWVLRNISFQVEPGEALGIIGQNGAGKSTLLKIMTGTTLPSEGTIHVNGRMAAILELGLGFHPDFSGKENAVMACRTMGTDPAEVQRILPEIEQFAELGNYIDQPLRVYSTGMQMRLAFSAVTAVRPEVLIIDEALAVGDAYFQHKCIQRIRSFKKQGTTIFLVSHDPGSVKSLCDRAILIERGGLIHEGDPDAVLDYYNGIIARRTANEEINQTEIEFGKKTTRSGSGKAKIVKVELEDANNRTARAFRVGEIAMCHCIIQFNSFIENPTIGILIRDRLGNDIFGTNTYYMAAEEGNYNTGETMRVTFTLKLNLGQGNYSVSVAVHSGENHLVQNYDWWDRCLVFQVIPNSSYSFIGCAALPISAELKRI